MELPSNKVLLFYNAKCNLTTQNTMRGKFSFVCLRIFHCYCKCLSGYLRNILELKTTTTSFWISAFLSFRASFEGEILLFNTILTNNKMIIIKIIYQSIFLNWKGLLLWERSISLKSTNNTKAFTLSSMLLSQEFQESFWWAIIRNQG